MSHYKMALSISLCLAVVLISSVQSSSARPVGIYGVSQDYPELSKHNIGTVFLPPVLELINSQAAAGRKVFLSLNVFGGTQGWKEYPDSIPIRSDGQKLTGQYGGVCPTHAKWRASRLSLLLGWLEEFGGKNGIAGVFLDFIRYPGKWGQPHPEIIDTCYCERCLLTFQTDTGVEIPDELMAVKEKASWIKQHASLKWMEWKKGNISSFIRDVRGLLDKYSGKRKLKLGVFLVPWKKSDFDGAISFHLAQDAEQFVPYIDVFSPMTYHQMVDQSVDWVGDISHYFKKMTDGEIWPIIQAEDVSANEFASTIGAASNGRAKRLLVYEYSAIKPDQWDQLSRFSPRLNLIPNPGFKFAGNNQRIGDWTLGEQVPLNWVTGEAEKVYDTRFELKLFEDGESPAVGITAGNDRQGSWSSELPECEPGEQFRFTGEFYRENRQDAGAYPEVSIWGEEYRLNTHRLYGRFQKLSADVECPGTLDERGKRFKFINHSSGNTFWMRNPLLLMVEKRKLERQIPPDDGFFPIGVYGGSADNLDQLRNIGLNTAVVGLDERNVSACLELNIHCTLSVPKNPEKLINDLNQLDNSLKKGRFSFYVNDEPGLHSFPVWKAEDIQRILKKRYPERFTNMAILRPQVIPDYQESADYFMLDQYPIPNMPLVWLSDSMDEAAGEVGRNRLHSVIQAFGGERFAYSGWPRLPTFAEMNNLAFLSVIHGSRGIYFYSWPEITSKQESKDDFEMVIRRLNSLRSWLQQKNDPEPVTVNMVSRYSLDPSGNPAVHCISKALYGTKMLMCSNSIRTYTEAEIIVPENGPDEWQEYYTGEHFYTVDDTVRLKFAPLEVKVLMEVVL